MNAQEPDPTPEFLTGTFAEYAAATSCLALVVLAGSHSDLDNFPMIHVFRVIGLLWCIAGILRYRSPLVLILFLLAFVISLVSAHDLMKWAGPGTSARKAKDAIQNILNDEDWEEWRNKNGSPEDPANHGPNA